MAEIPVQLSELLAGARLAQSGATPTDERRLWLSVLLQVIEDAGAQWEHLRGEIRPLAGESATAHRARVARRQGDYRKREQMRQREIVKALRWLFFDNADAQWVADVLEIDLRRLRRGLLTKPESPPGEVASLYAHSLLRGVRSNWARVIGGEVAWIKDVSRFRDVAAG
jgi:hypothetical protein